MASRAIEDLYGPLQPKFRELVAEAQKLLPSWTAFITDGFRTNAEQATLYAKGRTTAGPIVTNAKPGYSFHEYGLAVDIGWQKDGKLSYEKLDTLGPIARKLGFTWGADFGDKPHFEYSGGLTINQVKAGQRPSVGSTINEMDRVEHIKHLYRATQGKTPSQKELEFALGLSDDELDNLRFRDDVIGGYYKTATGKDCPESEKDFWQNAVNVDRDIRFLQIQWFGDHVKSAIDSYTKTINDLKIQLNNNPAVVIVSKLKEALKEVLS